MAHTSQQILEVVRKHIAGVLGIDPDRIQRENSMEELGANSLDRADVVTMAMEELGLRISPTQLREAQNIGDLVDIFFSKQ